MCGAAEVVFAAPLEPQAQVKIACWQVLQAAEVPMWCLGVQV